MNENQFWHSTDGQILTVKSKGDKAALTLAFWPRHPAEMDFVKARLAEIHFTERSSLARIGIEMHLRGTPTVDGNRLLLEADAFIYDSNFPNAAYWKKLLRPGTPVGRLFYAPPPPSSPPPRSGPPSRTTTSSCPTPSASTPAAASSSRRTRSATRSRPSSSV
jgi:hypothetical protein